MKISAEEHLMYRVMKALYESGIPISFKGSMVLRALLWESGYPEEARHTVDIDANWNSENAPTAEQMVCSIQAALQKNGIGLTVSLSRMFGEGRSAGFDLHSDSGELLFTMDVDVNRPAVPTKLYEIEGFRFRGVTPAQMIADKLSVVSSDKVFRRIKDVVDLYYLSGVFPFEKAVVLEMLQNSGKMLDTFRSFLCGTDELKHSYEKFRFSGDAEKPPFEKVYQTVKEYIGAVLPLQ